MTNIIVRHVLTQTMKMAYKMTQHEENSSICIIKSRLCGQEATNHYQCLQLSQVTHYKALRSYNDRNTERYPVQCFCL